MTVNRVIPIEWVRAGAALAFLAGTLLVSAPALAKPVEAVGVVNMQKILGEWKEVDSVNDKLSRLKDSKQGELDKVQERLREEKETIEKEIAKYSETERKKKTGDFEKKVLGLRDTHEKMMGKLHDAQAEEFKKLESRILAAVQDVSREMKLDLVLEKGVIFVGGTDITDSVLKKLNGR